MEIFPRRQVHVIVLDDLAANPRQCYQAALKFLGAPDDSRLGFPIHDPRRGNRSVRLLALVGVKLLSAKKISPAFPAELREYFVPEATKRENSLGRSFPAWKSSRPAEQADFQ